MEAQQAQSVRDVGLYLEPTDYLDVHEPSVRAYGDKAVGQASAAIDKAVRLYYAVRDGFLYDPYSMTLTQEYYRASSTIARGQGNCISKAVVLAATARGAGIPARLGFADVRNHLVTQRMRAAMGTDVFYYHGYTELYLEGNWVKATPAFNIELCRKFGVMPLEFDGLSDSIFHPFDASNRQHMEYVNDRGHRPDMPFEEFREAMLRYYPGSYQAELGGDFYAEAEAEQH